MTTKQIAYFFMCTLVSSPLSVLSMEKPTKYHPENTKFAFDFHGVIVTDPFVYFSDLKKALVWNTIPACNQQLPWFMCEVLKLILYRPSGEGFRNICTQYKQNDLASSITDFTNNVDLLPDTIAIIRELKEKGYELDLASNIDILFLNDLESNEKYAHIQEVLSLFTNKKAIDCSSIHITKPIKKPDLRYFSEYQKEHNSQGKLIIFIDDKLENVVAACQVGMTGIHFQNPKQLRNELVKHGIFNENKNNSL